MKWHKTSKRNVDIESYVTVRSEWDPLFARSVAMQYNARGHRLIDGNLEWKYFDDEIEAKKWAEQVHEPSATTSVTAQQIRGDMSRKKLGENSHKAWKWLRCFRGKCDGMPILDVIETHLRAGKKVKAGYTCTQVRGYHDKWILVYPPPVCPGMLFSDAQTMRVVRSHERMPGDWWCEGVDEDVGLFAYSETFIRKNHIVTAPKQKPQ